MQIHNILSLWYGKWIIFVSDNRKKGMKKAMFILAALLVTVPKAQAFEPLPKHEVSLQYGYVTAPEFALMFAGIFGTLFSLGTASMSEIKCTGEISGQYYHRLGERWMVGCAGGYEHAGLSFEDSEGNVRPASVNGHFMSLLPSAKLYWNSKMHFAMYTKVQAGATMTVMPDDDDENHQKADLGCYISFNLVPAGMEFGGESLRGFAELGFGTQGIISVGLKKTF